MTLGCRTQSSTGFCLAKCSGRSCLPGQPSVRPAGREVASQGTRPGRWTISVPTALPGSRTAGPRCSIVPAAQELLKRLGMANARSSAGWLERSRSFRNSWINVVPRSSEGGGGRVCPRMARHVLPSQDCSGRRLFGFEVHVSNGSLESASRPTHWLLDNKGAHGDHNAHRRVPSGQSRHPKTTTDFLSRSSIGTNLCICTGRGIGYSTIVFI
mmetsp:Transcript_41280/g.110349  ORF Transcript_41280/g.110349 Transcript_41280/m.110349 type:complete len:213 (-) Transcript_41280:595-1233(-)